MTEELFYKKNQLLLDIRGETWILVDIIEVKSLLNKPNPKLSVFLKKKLDKPVKRNKTIKLSYDKFTKEFSPYLHTDKESVKTVMTLESLLKKTI